MNKLINVVRFDVTDGNKQIYNYIPVMKNGSTKVFINYVLHIDQSSIDQMKENSINKLCMEASSEGAWTINKSVNIPLHAITGEDFLNISLTFLINNSDNQQPINNVDVILCYMNNEKTRDTIFSTKLPLRKID